MDINGKPTNFRITVVKPYYRDDSTEIPQPADDDDNVDDPDLADEWLPPLSPVAALPGPTEAAPPRPRRGRPPGSKNKPKAAVPQLGTHSNLFASANQPVPSA